jgi:glutamate decarboxylase
MMHRLVFDRPVDFYQHHVQNPESTLGVLTSGGTLANTTALWCARNAALPPARDFAGVEEEGFAAALHHYGFERAVIIGSSNMHYSFEKAAGVLGLGTRNLIRIAVDTRQRVDVAALRKAVDNCRASRTLVVAIIGVAGSTDSGSVDDLHALAQIAHDAGIHFHVDASWAGPLLFSRQHRSTLSGIEKADSVTIDGHKQLYLPMGIGMVMLRDPALAKTIEKQARYIIRPGSSDLGRRSLEGSRPAMALFLHAALHVLGQEGYEFLVNEGVRKARYLAARVSEMSEFEMMLDPETNIVNYRFIPEQFRDQVISGGLDAAANELINAANKELQRRQREAGASFVSRTTLDSTRYGAGVPITVLRAVVANPLTTEDDIQAILEEQVRMGDLAALAEERNRRFA